MNQFGSLSFFLGLVLLSSAARADDALTRARDKARSGIDLYEAGKFEEAYRELAEAEALHHAPTILLYMAHSKKVANHLVEALKLYRDVAAESLAADAPEQFKQARAQAEKEIEALSKRIPKLSITIVNGPSDARVTVDGVAVAGTDSAEKAVDPGEHVVRATAGSNVVSSRVHAAEWTTTPVSLAFTFASPSPSPTPKGSIVPAAMAFGIGTAGLAFGAITGAVTLAKAGDLRSACSSPDASGVRHCSADQRASADSAGTFATLSTVGFIVAGVGAATGVVLLVARPTSKTGGATSVGLRFGVGNAGIEGVF